MKVLLAHPGTQYSFQLAKQLYKRGMLYEFHTGLAFGKDSWMFKLLSKLPASLYHKFSNRFIDDVPDKIIKRYPFIEINALLRLKLNHEEENVLYRRNRQFQNSIPDHAITGADAVIGFDTSSWILADRCKKLAKKFFLDVSIAHPVSKDKVYRHIIKLYPKWQFSVRHKEHKHIAVEEAEMELASHIVVASSFTLSTYVEHGVPTKKISINPYGVDTQFFKPLKKEKIAGDPVRFVFVGLVDARKGIPFLLESWSKIVSPAVELTLIGPITSGIEKLINTYYPSVIVKGKLAFNELKEILPGYDVMIFPSFFEGFGLVIPEAMASGLPVITTSATCGPDIIEHGKEGFVIDPGDEDQIKKAIDYFITQPGNLYKMGEMARAKAEQFSWDAYGDKWDKILNGF